MIRISRLQMFMEMAESATKRSTCYRSGNGAILVNKNRPISIGYNGPPSGEEHCQGEQCPLDSQGGCTRSDHAEANAIKFAQEEFGNKIYWPDLQLICTSAPCLPCSVEIVNSGIQYVIYKIPYRLKAGTENLLACRINVFRLTSSGFIIDEKTKKLQDSHLR